ncbi:MAG TPA: transposase [Gemmatimonadaceae bacterium]|nr:transposase [Gemmatimonadaceae bacterium]
MGNLVRKSPAWREKDDVFQSVPGVRQVLSFTLLPALCELGRLSGSEIAKPVRIAPLNRDWSTLKGRRFEEGGGASVRMVLYMGAVMATKCTPVIRSFCQRPITAGKPRS